MVSRCSDFDIHKTHVTTDTQVTETIKLGDQLGKRKRYLEHDEALLSLRQWQHLDGKLPF